MRFNHGVVGGTFDLLHNGHKKLLTRAFEEAEHVTIGLSLPALYNNKPLASQIQDYTTRQKSLRDYLKTQSWDIRSTIVPLTDFYGSTLVDTSLEAIFVTLETQRNAERINIKRLEKNLSLLEIITAEYALGEDGEIISSQRIREGLIARDGISFQMLFKQKKLHILPRDLREVLQKPHGPIIKDARLLPAKDNLIITVGDVVSRVLRDEKLLPAISIIDGKTQRAKIDQITTDKYFSHLTPLFTNEPGTINSSIAANFLSAINKYHQARQPQVILVNGEEDLLALPAILLSPLGSFVIYGQHNIGMVVVQITEEKKEEIRNLLMQFS